jgi:hypothetical protein
MSTVAYAMLTNRRDAAPVGQSFTAAPPGVTSYVDAVAALVPAEVLSLHALVISIATKTTKTTGTDSITVVSDQTTLLWTFVALIVLSAALYAVPRLNSRWDRWDWLRILIAPIAFTAWTMLQPATAFDAVYPSLPDTRRTVIAVFVAAVLGAVTSFLAQKADQKPPPTAN